MRNCVVHTNNDSLTVNVM